MTKLYNIVDTLILIICLPFYLSAIPSYWIVTKVFQFGPIRRWYWSRTYRPGALLSRFVAVDIKREIQVLDTAKIEHGILTVRTRTWNLLHAGRGIAGKPEFGPVQELQIAKLRQWNSPGCGGPLPVDLPELEQTDR